MKVPDARNFIAMDTYEGEAQRRLNPFGPARPPRSQTPPNERRGIRRLWSKLLTLLGRAPADDTPGDDTRGV